MTAADPDRSFCVIHASSKNPVLTLVDLPKMILNNYRSKPCWLEVYQTSMAGIGSAMIRQCNSGEIKCRMWWFFQTLQWSSTSRFLYFMGILPEILLTLSNTKHAFLILSSLVFINFRMYWMSGLGM